MFALCGTEDGFLSGGKDGTIKVWTWGYELFHVSGDELNTIKIGGCIRSIAPLYTEDNVRLREGDTEVLESMSVWRSVGVC